jgi:hypothetical protein
MTTDGVIFGTVTSCGDHSHLEWICCDCRAFCFIGCQRQHRYVCVRSRREYLVIGLTCNIKNDGMAAARSRKTELAPALEES